MQRIFVLTAAVALMLAGASSSSTFAAKRPHPLCNMERCLAFCAKQGGQPRLCPDFCVKRINERKAAGECG